MHKQKLKELKREKNAIIIICKLQYFTFNDVCNN